MSIFTFEVSLSKFLSLYRMVKAVLHTVSHCNKSICVDFFVVFLRTQCYSSFSGKTSILVVTLTDPSQLSCVLWYFCYETVYTKINCILFAFPLLQSVSKNIFCFIQFCINTVYSTIFVFLNLKFHFANILLTSSEQ